MEVYYVDPSAAGSSEDGSTGNPYLSLNAALAGKCNKTFTDAIQLRCRTSGSTPDTTRAYDGGLTSMVTSASNYLEIVAETGHRAGLAWDATKYHLYPAYGTQAGTALGLSHDYIRVDGLQIGISTQTNTAEIVYWSNGDTGRLTNCLIRGTDSSAQLTRGLSSIDGVNLINCVFYAIGSNVGSSCIKNHGDSKYYNCTFIQSSGIIAVDITDGTCVAKNCYAGGATFKCYNVEAAGSLAMTTCASSDTTGSGGLTNIAVNTTNFTNVTPGSEDWHIPSGSALKDTGTDTSGDAAPFNFTTDIEGGTRGPSWDIGADEYGVGGGGGGDTTLMGQAWLS
jgi:hypothetical protein